MGSPVTSAAISCSACILCLACTASDPAASSAPAAPSDASASGGSSSGGFSAGGSSNVSTGGSPTNTGGTLSSTGGSLSAGGTTPGTGGASSSIDSGTPPSGEPNRVPVFIAVGHMERTTVSCDDGRSWIKNQSLDDTVRCFENSLDCDHTKGAGRGLAYGNGYFVASFGWGEPGRLRRSRDGITWETAKDGTIFAGVAFGGGTFVANSNTVLVSNDALTWQNGGDLGLSIWNTRAIGYFPQNGGGFVVTGETGTDTDVVLSRTQGATFVHPTVRPPECVSSVKGIASSASTIVAASANGYVCTSKDAGDTWTVQQLGADNLSSPPLWSGTEFQVWNRNVLYRSADGIAWTHEDVTPSNISIGAVARSPSGTYVATNDGWLVWYEKQQFFRSTDGVHWDVLDPSKFTGSHPINFIEFGWADPSVDCPLP